MRIRPVRRDDATALQWRCWPDMSQFDVETRLIDVISRGERGLAWGVVAVDENDTPIAYGVLARWGRRSEIGDLVVNEDWRGHGIGSALIEHLLEQACALNLHEVEIGAA
ncbi:MAG: GNAT family N-acetyltransferase [Anaerolineae bacterium]